MKKEINKIDSKNSHKFIKGIVIILSILILVVIALGFMFPGLVWTRSLGIHYTQTDYNSIMNKLNYSKDDTPTLDSKDLYNYVYGEPTSIDTYFTSEELTAFFNENRPSFYPIKNFQIKINMDGSIEIACSANVNYFLDDVLGGKYTREQIQNEIPALGILPNNVNIYINFTGSITNNVSSIYISSASVQGVDIPNKYLNSTEAINYITSGLNDFILKVNNETGSSFESMTVENGIIKFKGNVPSSLERIQK